MDVDPFAGLTDDLDRAAAANPAVVDLITDPPEFEIGVGWILVAILPRSGDDRAVAMLLAPAGAPVDAEAISTALCARVAALTDVSVRRPVAEVLGLPEVVRALEPTPA